ncbi:MAG TPA: tripartite tricarboxylate transporter substrate-binding protein [Nocardioidaceae bacterium]|nr:tripartite tricarboxylate transporter substrate-binding protein [Nocardioidaceae bacterium]
MKYVTGRSGRTGLTVAVAAAAAGLLLAGCGTTTQGAGAAEAADELKIIVPADPGGGWDQTGRAMQKDLQDNDLVNSAQVVNVGGAGGTVGLTQLANERDPNTLMVMGLVMVGAIETNQSPTTLEDTTPIARLTTEPLVVVVPPDSPYETVGDLVADIAERGQGVSVTGGSAGGADHILAGLMLKKHGVSVEDIASKLNYIPYSGGGESLAALLGNKVDAGISGVGEYAEQVKAGKLRALAVSGKDRSPALPDTPTLQESGLDLVLSNWRGVVAPGDIDESKAEELVALVEDLHATDAWATTLKENDWQDAFLAGKEFEAALEEETTTVQQTLADIGLVQP